ncbi:MAG TPA: peptide chain release factor 1, partial [Acidobacteria bacterium]|nr:peptide chain release factor 1 [Acidobacteriota bacterium]
MFEKLNAIEARYDELMQSVSNLSAESDSAQYRKHAKALAEIQPLVEKFRDYKGILVEIEQARE